MLGVAEELGEEGVIEYKGEEMDYDTLRERLEARVLEVQVRGGWHSPNSADEAIEFKIELCWGGPAVRLTGDLDNYNQPESAELQYQDWFEAWQILEVSEEEEAVLLKFASLFYFGE